MSISTMPTLPGIKKSRFGIRALTMEFWGARNRLGQTSRQKAWRWTARYELPPMTRAQAEPWIAFLSGMNGRRGRFYGYDPARPVAQGSVIGSPTVFGASNTGNTLITVGWTPGIAPVLVAGDYISWVTSDGRREMHKVGTSAFAGGTLLYNENGYNANGYGYGEAILDIVPEIRDSPSAGVALIVNGVRCIMRLKGDEEAAWDVDEASIYSIAFESEEIVTSIADIYFETLPAIASTAPYMRPHRFTLASTTVLVASVSGHIRAPSSVPNRVDLYAFIRANPQITAVDKSHVTMSSYGYGKAKLVAVRI